jgi:CheY-like chemotaxis protein
MYSIKPCSPHVLVVDDEEIIRAVIAEAMGEMGMAVTEARDGVEALDALAAGLRPCLAIVDLMMPRMSGEEFARTVREMTLDLPIVSMSAGEDVLWPPLVAAHLPKPFSLERLEELVVQAGFA